MTNNAIDLYDSPLDVSQLDGIELVIQNLWTGRSRSPYAVPNLQAALAAGKRIAAYGVINPSQPDNAARIRELVPDAIWSALEFVAVDCELYDTLTPAKVRAESDRLAAMLPGRPRVLYTVISYWWVVMGDDQTFGDHWLWDARPDGRPFVAYGGWPNVAVIGVQTSSTVQIGKMSVDYDLFDMGVLTMAEDPQIAIQRACMYLAGDALNNNMAQLVARLVYFGVLPPGTVALKASL